MKASFTLTPSILREITPILHSHKGYLAHPFDSYCEDKLEESAIYRIVHDGADIGYTGIIGEELRYFHILPAYFKYAPDALEYCIREMNIKAVNVITQDSLLLSLIAEWDYKVEMEACYFIDLGRRQKPQVEAGKGSFRTAGSTGRKV
jgi:hypothetical protein